MLRGDRVGLRARYEEDVPVLRRELFNDVVHFSRAHGSPWRPLGSDAGDPLLTEGEPSPQLVKFSVVELTGGALAGMATLWGIDEHNRSAHIGVGLLPSARGRGYGTDVVAVLCHYAFVVRGLRRLQIETLADNTAMRRSAERNGFVREGLTRSSAWALGAFHDQVLFGLLADDWAARGPAAPGAPGSSNAANSSNAVGSPDAHGTETRAAGA